MKLFPTLIPDARRAWRYLSVQASVVGGAIVLAWGQIPDEVKGYLPPEFLKWMVFTVFVVIPVLRVIDQGGTATKTDAAP
jgi:hypothetical protein